MSSVSISECAFADDVAVLASTEHKLQTRRMERGTQPIQYKNKIQENKGYGRFQAGKNSQHRDTRSTNRTG